MGVPSFYRWLADKYPLVIVDVIEDETRNIDGQEIPVNSAEPNPNGIEFDNLYLDMNGIIHPCFHPEDRPSPTTLPEVFQCIFSYIDRLFAIVRPRKLLYMAIDGVAPRAKMNQQRSRRFRAAKDAADAAAEEDKLRKELEREGRILPPKIKSATVDSNIITPGTEFMALLSVALQYYIHRRLNEDEGWRNVKVILSDAQVPGEGEHKVMTYIREQRNLPGYDPNTRHCIYGLDADLIMLSLATHELHFTILREVVFVANQKDKCFLCGQEGHLADQCEGKPKRKRGEHDADPGGDSYPKKPYQFLHVWILREYLEFEFDIPGIELDFERVVDDFVFMCFFVGNDFLPHMPTLEIREGAINLLMTIYRKEFENLGGYLTNSGEVELDRVEKFIQAVGSYEEAIFQKRARMHQRQKDRRDREKGKRRINIDETAPARGNNMQLAPLGRGSSKSPGRENVSAAQSLRDRLRAERFGVLSGESDADALTEGTTGTVADVHSEDVAPKAAVEESLEDLEDDLQDRLKTLLREKGDLFASGKAEEDNVRLGEEGWKMRYYKEKFKCQTMAEMEELRKDVVHRYVEGLCWVMRYYYQGVCSWNWYYPYHYAPFASDLFSLFELEIHFFLGKPFKPFDQLMGVLPAASHKALPTHYQTLMYSPTSPVIDLYPTDFPVDMNGKRFAWQGVALLPFIDEKRLLKAIAQVEHTLNDEQRRRNQQLNDQIYVSSSHSLAPVIFAMFDKYGHLEEQQRSNFKHPIDPTTSDSYSDGMNGFLVLCNGDPSPPVLRAPFEGVNNLTNNQVVCAIFLNPTHHRHICSLLEGVKVPEKVVLLQDFKSQTLWHEDHGRRPNNVQDRAPVKNALSGQSLGVAAQRLIVNTLQIQRPTGGYNQQPRAQYQQQNQRQPYSGYPNHSVSGPIPGIIRIPPPYSNRSAQYPEYPPGFPQQQQSSQQQQPQLQTWQQQRVQTSGNQFQGRDRPSHTQNRYEVARTYPPPGQQNHVSPQGSYPRGPRPVSMRQPSPATRPLVGGNSFAALSGRGRGGAQGYPNQGQRNSGAPRRN